MRRQQSFIAKCLAGDAGPDDIDDFVDAWHEGGSGLPLWDFLGMSREEYGLWVENAGTLPVIVSSHRSGATLDEAARQLAQASNGSAAAEMRRVEAWLKTRKRQAV